MQKAKVQQSVEDSPAQAGDEALISLIKEDGAKWRINEEAGNVDLRQRTTDYARRIIRLYVALTKDPLAQVLGKQLLRSGTSVGANYRECSRGRSKASLLPNWVTAWVNSTNPLTGLNSLRVKNSCRSGYLLHSGKKPGSLSQSLSRH